MAESELIQRLDRTYEFDREPVTQDHLQSGAHFAGFFAGEHVAATEFVIGALLVSWGAGVRDIFYGLLLGNLLAVLSWTFIVAPIAVQTRLTLYWYMRRIAGVHVTALYDILNAFLYCILAGSMITVSASAVRIPFHIPPQTQWYPEDLRFVLVVLVVGALVVTLAILGFKQLARFSTLCSPWLMMMFVVGALATLPRLILQLPADQQGHGMTTLHAVFTYIWTGQTAEAGTALGFWHVAAFAWICNMAMHVGLSDMAILRYAKRSSYGLFSAFGMFLGHYMAWIAAGIMGAAAAVALNTPLSQLDSGEVALGALGISGAFAVVVAGWTTSNPTLYRAGLALQAVTPNWPRWRVTLIAGIATTVIACFPFVFTKLLSFVGLYGLLLMPMGAIVFVEHWLFPRIGLQRYWVARKGLALNWPALLSWILSLAVAITVERMGYVHLFFLALPTWLLTAGFYILFAYLAGAGRPLPAEAPAGAGAAPTGSAVSTQKRSASFEWPLLLVAAGCLAVALLLAGRVALTGAADYAAALDGMKMHLVWITIVYFVAGILWSTQREKREKGRA